MQLNETELSLCSSHVHRTHDDWAASFFLFLKKKIRRPCFIENVPKYDARAGSKGLTRVGRNVFVDYSVPPCRRRAPLICAFRTRGFSSGLALVAGWIASASAHRRRCNATCKLNATLAEIEIDRSFRDDGHRSHPGRSVACHVQRCFLHAWCPTDADLEFAVRRQHLRTPSGPTCP